MSDDAPTDLPWWTNAVVYQIYPRSFADSNGDGIGDLGGIRQHLDHLVHLGVDVVWLSPIYRSPQVDNGYDISDYQSIDPLFGTLDEYDALLAECHARGLKLIMDLVVNHTSDQHAWFVESRSSLDNPKRDWYLWRDPVDRSGVAGLDPADAARREPNLWNSVFSGPGWQLDETTGQYYLHIFAREQPDLNWANAEMRDAVYSMMTWWLDRGVDGFRMDVINTIAKIERDLVGESRGYVMGPQVHEYLHEMHERVFAGRDAQLITVGETPGATVDDAVAFTAQDRGELDMVFQFEHVGLDHGPRTKFDNIPLALPALKASLARWQEGLADRGWNSLYFGNHDQPRSVSRFGDDGAFRYESATALAGILHLHRGTPYVYQGDEIGMTNAGYRSLSDYRDLESLNWAADELATGRPLDDVLDSLAFRSRDNARTPVQWSAGPGVGFTTGVPWLAPPASASTVNVQADLAAGSRSIVEFYRRLIALRHSSAVVRQGRFELLEPSHPALWAFTRTLDTSRLLAMANLSGAALPLDGLSLARAQDPGADHPVLLGNYAPTVAAESLRPWEFRVLALD
ncbi:glycoside hydrolase family 13 protein [Frondihabitans australicus]|uniref:Oligo-1,6-glucosidase n=1 Tax=Frondihabitans australicus TaxID=386892 RepID=A0A495IEX0_9MICO|nr:alpha-glucosidase [Frondihabitans australicus]RKR73556.1 oligo-1,6-glucosidase [Frondihabitans australicus]